VKPRNLPIHVDPDVLATDWFPGPLDGSLAPVVVSFTDFQARSEQDVAEIFQIGLKLAESWPIMHGAVGLWLWGRPTELRGGSVSVWESARALRQFVRWPVHMRVLKEWRDRIDTATEIWLDTRFDPSKAWSRAEIHMRKPHPGPGIHEPGHGLADRDRLLRRGY
jgi:hypothetical protein